MNESWLCVTTSGEFEVCRFDENGYALRRHVATIEEAWYLLSLPLDRAQRALLGSVEDVR